MPAHPVVGRLQAVQADGQGAHPGAEQPLLHRFVIEPAVGDQAPGEAAPTDFLPDRLDIRAQERLPAGEHHDEIPGTVLCGKGVQRAQEVLQRHILLPAQDGAVTAAVAAMQVAARRALPEQIVQFVDGDLVVAEQAEEERIHSDGGIFTNLRYFCARITGTGGLSDKQGYEENLA